MLASSLTVAGGNQGAKARAIRGILVEAEAAQNVPSVLGHQESEFNEKLNGWIAGSGGHAGIDAAGWDELRRICKISDFPQLKSLLNEPSWRDTLPFIAQAFDEIECDGGARVQVAQEVVAPRPQARNAGDQNAKARAILKILDDAEKGASKFDQFDNPIWGDLTEQIDMNENLKRWVTGGGRFSPINDSGWEELRRIAGGKSFKGLRNLVPVGEYNENSSESFYYIDLVLKKIGQ